MKEKPQYLHYRDLQTNYVIKIQNLDNKKLVGIFVSVYDIKSHKKIFTKKYHVSLKERYPFLAHKFIIDLAKFLGYNDLDWMQKFVIFARYTGPKKSEIVIGDYTLTYQQTIIKGGLSLFPKWKGDKQRTFFYTDSTNKPVLYEVDLYSGSKKRVISSGGMLVCSDVSKNGKELLLTIGNDDQPDIYKYNLDTKKKIKLTSYKGIDVNGNFVDNDKAIVFVSDRMGKPNIFYKKIDSSGVRQLIYYGNNNNFCTTYKEYIAFTSRESNSEFKNNTFNLYLASTKSDYLRKLTTTGRNLFPRFSDSGSTLLYIKRYYRDSALGIIRLQKNKNFLFPLNVGKLQSIDW